MLVTIAAFVFVLGVLIFVHEFGHFLAAKAVGIGVPRFSIGFGPATPLRFRRGETEYVVAWFPLGGYVKMASREEQEAMGGLEGGETPETFPPEQLFESKPLWARVMVISAGVFMNALFAWVVYAAVAGIYGRTEDPTTTVAHVNADFLPPAAKHLADIPRGTQIVRINGDSMRSRDAVYRAVADPASDRLRLDFAGDVEPVILPIRGTDTEERRAVLAAIYWEWEPAVGAVRAGGPAAEAGLEVGDRFVSIEGDTTASFYGLFRVVDAHPGDTLDLVVQRGDGLVPLVVVPEVVELTNPATGEALRVGRIGVDPPIDYLRIKYGLVGAMAEGWRQTVVAGELVYVTLKGFVTREVSPREIGGPIFIGQLSGELARVSLAALLEFMALLSVNLAILNLLPIPVLDGGHLVFLAVEGVRGRPLSLAARMRLIQFGMFLLFGLMIYVFTNDILRILGG